MSEERKSVTWLKGIGEATEEQWKKKGIDSLQTLAQMNPKEVVKKIGIELSKAQRYVAEARSIVKEDMVFIRTAKEVMKERAEIVQRISTGSKKVDAIMGGGIPTSAMTLVAGKSAVGKTQIGIQACVNTYCDLGAKSVYVDTEGTFDGNRMLQMATLGKSRDMSLDDIFLVDATNFVVSKDKIELLPDKLFRAYTLVEKKLEEGEDIKLLVVDSFNGLMRRVFIGRETLAHKRSPVMAQHIGYLQTLQNKYNIAVLLTAQIYSTVTDDYEQKRRFGISEHIWGGEYFLHSCTYGISLDLISGGKKTEEVWEAYCFKAPNQPRRTAEYQLNKFGVRDT